VKGGEERRCGGVLSGISKKTVWSGSYATRGVLQFNLFQVGWI